MRINGVRVTVRELRCAIRAFILFRTIDRIVSTADVGKERAKKLAHAFRIAMIDEGLPAFEGPVELDETYIGGQRKNKRLHIRRIKSKRGAGTEKLPFFGIFDRASGKVFVDLEPRKLDWRYMRSTIEMRVARGARILTDGLSMYEKFAESGYVVESVNHDAGEYVRGDVHTNNIEGFWGIMKRRMGCIGGMRRDRLHLFAKEFAWRFNHRSESDEIKERALQKLVLERWVSG